MKMTAKIAVPVLAAILCAVTPAFGDARGKCVQKAKTKQSEGLKACNQNSGQKRKDCQKNVRDTFSKESAACK